MSTKTSIKRIALVAVAALGFGMVSNVPANAAGEATEDATALLASYKLEGTVGTAISVVATQTTTNGGTPNSDTDTVYTAAVTVRPTGSINEVALTKGTAPTDYTFTQTSSKVVTSNAAAAAAALTGGALGTLTFTPDVPGEYRISVTPTGPAGTLTAAYLSIYVSGTGATVASSGIGAATITGVVGGQVKFNFVPAQTSVGVITASNTYVATSEGAGSIAGASAVYTTLPTAVAGTSYSAAAALAGTLAAPSTTGGIGPNNGSTADWSGGAKMIIGSGTTPVIMTVTAQATVAGTQTITINSISATTGAPTLVKTVTINWGTAAAASTLSTAYLNDGGTYVASDPTSAVSVSKTAGTSVLANIGVTLKDSYGNALNGQKLTVTVSGPGAIVVHPLAVSDGSLLDYDATGAALTTSGVRASTDASANATNLWYIGVSADGTAGKSTITISVGTTVIATKTMYFYGAPAKVTATQIYSIAKASSTGAELGDSRTNTSSTTGYVPAVSILVEDADGNDVAATVTCLPTDTTVIASCTIAADDNATYGAGVGYYNASVTSANNGVSGKSTTVVFRTQLASGAYVTSEPVTFTLGGSITATKATLDKSSYTPGEAMQLTVTATDASGNATFDGQSIAYSISANKPVGGSLPATSKVFAKGKYATSLTAPTLFAPSVDGDFVITVLGNDVDNTAVTVTGTVSNETSSAAIDAANEATDAANAATDAANAAAEAADAATAAAQDAQAAVAELATKVASLMAGIKAQITSLTNLVIKIQKKVRA